MTGVVLDSGDGVTHAVPIYEGFAMPHSIMRVDIAGRDVTRYLKTLIRKEGYNFRTTAEFEIVRSIKEKICYLSSFPQKEETAIEPDKVMLYTLPDGNTFDVCYFHFFCQFFKFLILFYDFFKFRLVQHVFVRPKFYFDLIYLVKNVKAFTKCSFTQYKNLIWI